MEFLSEYGMFLAKSITLVAAVVFILVALVSAAAKNKKEPKGSILVQHLNKEIDDFCDEIKQHVEQEEDIKKAKKALKKA